MNKKRSWLKNRGYLHVSRDIDVHKEPAILLKKLNDKAFVSRHAFFPLIHAVIKERRYKKVDNTSKGRAHKILKKGKHKKLAKVRPLHYPTHIDALIFGFYAEELLNAYNKHIEKIEFLSESIIAYRKIPISNSDKNKSTIHFAHEAFEEIRKRAKSNDCIALKFDITSFFNNIDHAFLKDKWCRIIGESKLPRDHFSVFKAATRFSYILLDDLRLKNNQSGRKSGFNERELANIRKKGYRSFFESPAAFRDKIKNKELKIYRYPFRNKSKEPVGIPQGLPISAVLANLYLLDFDRTMINEIVVNNNGYYRRYSDDIIVFCSVDSAEKIEELVRSEIEKSKVEISKEKTEKFLFTNDLKGKLTSYKMIDGKRKPLPFTFLGFEFDGQKILIKSSNLAKFYRRMIYAVKRKSRTAIKQYERNPLSKPCLFRRQLKKLYTTLPLSSTKISTNKKWLEADSNGDYYYKTKKISKDLRGNYLTYVDRASVIMQEPAIKHQIKKHKNIFNKAIERHFTRKIPR